MGATQLKTVSIDANVHRRWVEWCGRKHAVAGTIEAVLDFFLHTPKMLQLVVTHELDPTDTLSLCIAVLRKHEPEIADVIVDLRAKRDSERAARPAANRKRKGPAEGE